MAGSIVAQAGRTCSDRKHFSRRYGGAGFTLVEVLVVLVIVAVLAGILVLNYGRSDRDRVADEASRLATVLNLALEEAVVRSSELGVIMDADGYRFVVFDPRDRRWEPVTVQPFAAHQLDAGVELAVALPEESMTSETRRVIQSLRTREVDLQPQLLLFPSGEMTPFELTLTLADEIAQVEGDGVNPVQWAAET